ncbi:hypothetical protein [Labrys wisconsinensis]|uniref:Uncharacterized protein n=1 Tax=Labrys wisconsinensis TaxID=425677 RepID=A0ABU0J5H5_9HYPH|nr:hypothetical protein [Labrys wisconsinensis]MDQ0469521.1 hypothetical protein [Labrys wisconsinensis]
MRFLPVLAALALCASAVPAAAAMSCHERIGYVRTIIDKDLKVGFIGKEVYAQMVKDLDAAGIACQSGQDAKAQLLISATQSRHGYPVR